MDFELINVDVRYDETKLNDVDDKLTLELSIKTRERNSRSRSLKKVICKRETIAPRGHK